MGVDSFAPRERIPIDADKEMDKSEDPDGEVMNSVIHRTRWSIWESLDGKRILKTYVKAAPSR